MNRFLALTDREIGGLKEAWNMSRIFIEIDSRGRVIREIGVNDVGDVVHRHPGLPSRAKYGVFDLAEITAPNSDDIGSEEYDRLWSA
jgi:hypothetical protein